MMLIASYANTMRGARRIAASRVVKLPAPSRPPMPRLGIRLELCPEPLPESPAREIIARVAAWHGLTFEDIIGKRHRLDWSTARRDAVAAVKMSKPHLSLTQLALVFDRDHTTILHHLRKAGMA